MLITVICFSPKRWKSYHADLISNTVAMHICRQHVLVFNKRQNQATEACPWSSLRLIGLLSGTLAVTVGAVDVFLLPASSTQVEYSTSAIQCWESVQQPLVINQPHYLKDIFRVISADSGDNLIIAAYS